MKQQKQWFAALAVASSLVIVNSLQAQTYNFSTGNVAYMGTAGGWNSSMYSISATGLEVNDTTATPGNTYGGGYYDLGAAIGSLHVNTDSTQVTMVLTVTGPISDYLWNFTGFNLNDAAVGNDGGYQYPNPSPYSGYGNGGNPPGMTWVQNSPTSYTLTQTGDLSPAFLAAVQADNGWVYGLNLNFNPTSASGAYDMTFNSITFSPVPEPTSLALAGLGAAGLLVFRRRK